MTESLHPGEAPAPAGGLRRPAAVSGRSGPVRVVYVLNSFEIGGTELNAIRTAERLDPTRIRLQVLAFHGHGPLRRRYEALGIPIEILPLRNLYGIRAMLAIRRAAVALRAARVQIVHTHDIYCNIVGVPIGRLAGAEGVIASRRWWKRTPRAGLLAVNRLAYTMAHRVLTNSPSVGRMLEEEERVPPGKVVVIPNFLEPEAFDCLTLEARAAWRRQLGLPPDGLLVGMVARLAAVKDHGTFLRALAQLLAKGLRIEGVLVGDGPERGALERLAAELNLAGSIHFLGEMPPRPTCHQLFDISVLTSLSEAFPNSLLEAMAAGIPVVATRVGGVPDAVKDGETGFLVPPGAPDDLARAILRLAVDAEERVRLGRRGRTDAQGRYEAASILERLQSLYESLAWARA